MQLRSLSTAQTTDRSTLPSVSSHFSFPLKQEVWFAGCKTQPLCIWESQLQRFHSSGVTCWPPSVGCDSAGAAPGCGTLGRTHSQACGVQHQLVPLSWHACGIHTMTRAGNLVFNMVLAMSPVPWDHGVSCHQDLLEGAP